MDNMLACIFLHIDNRQRQVPMFPGWGTLFWYIRRHSGGHIHVVCTSVCPCGLMSELGVEGFWQWLITIVHCCTTGIWANMHIMMILPPRHQEGMVLWLWAVFDFISMNDIQMRKLLITNWLYPVVFANSAVFPGDHYCVSPGSPPRWLISSAIPLFWQAFACASVTPLWAPH